MSGESLSTSTVESPGPPIVTLKQKSKKKTLLCSFYAKGATCRFGNKCRFLHEKPAPSPAVESYQVTDDGTVKGSSTESKKYIPPHRLRRTHHEAVTDSASYTSEPLPLHQNTFGQLCKFYTRNGHCKLGDDCRYLHEQSNDGVNPRQFNNDSYDGSKGGRGHESRRRFLHADRNRDEKSREDKQCTTTPAGNDDNIRQSFTKKSIQKPKKPVCKYFKMGNCRHADECKYWHPGKLLNVLENVEEKENNALYLPVDKLELNDKDDTPPTSVESRPPAKKAIVQPVTEFSLQDVTDEEASKLRITEINALMKRFPRAEQTSIPRWTEDAYKIIFVPSDPDWPYDVKEVHMTILFPEAYPRVCMILKLSKEQALPDTLRRYLYNTLNDWLTKRYDRLIQKIRMELVFKPFLRWLDKNMEDLFTEGLRQYQREIMAKAAGIEIVTADELKERYNYDDEESEDDDEEGSDEEENEYSEEYSDDEEDDENKVVGERIELSEENKNAIDPVKKGTEIKLHNLQLREGATTLMALKLQLIVFCQRCKNKEEISVRQNQGISLTCGQCHHQCLVAFRPAIIHQFSSVLGYLDLDECSAFDLILTETDFMIGCEGCNKEMKIQGIAPGPPKDIWCQYCHKKLKIVVETTRFLQLQPNELAVSGLQAVAGKKKIKAVKDPLIKEGSALPENGTCRHYKKSFRWLRFPCCGKAYPCDVCHDEEEDHHFVYANRMICGFCAKEQYYSPDRPCKGCDSNMTKKVTSHWEAGKGCRDKIKMSRGDEKKYANTNKTISRKSIAKKSTGKKTTKLRHT